MEARVSPSTTCHTQPPVEARVQPSTLFHTQLTARHAQLPAEAQVQPSSVEDPPFYSADVRPAEKITMCLGGCYLR